MTGQELKHLRGDNTREEYAQMLGTTASTLNNWERGISPVPDWVADKVFRSVNLTLPLEDLAELLDIARREKISFDALLSSSVKAYIEKHKIITLPTQGGRAEKVADDVGEYGKGKK